MQADSTYCLVQSRGPSDDVPDAAAVLRSGGHASSGRTNDLLLLELSGWTWSQPVTTGTAPSPRSGAAMCVGHGRYLVIHGGRNNFVLDTAHVLDLMTRTWVDVSLHTLRF